MKYMGSKRAMLANGLGSILRAEAKSAHRVVDLFCGSACVAWFTAREIGKPVLATDLQKFAIVLAKAVIERTSTIDSESLARRWFKQVREHRRLFPAWREAKKLDDSAINTVTWCKRARALCESMPSDDTVVWNAYGGYYFSPTQALTFDALMASLPERGPLRMVCLAATVIAASKCAASPGHTAQPFKASLTAGPFLREAWLRQPFAYVKTALGEICPQHALKKGRARLADAQATAATLSERDLVFVDPPYSGVHYSRFYHVLETIARGRCGPVEGTGRYPPVAERPTSSFSRKSEAPDACSELLKRLARAGARVVLTFPADDCSNGISGAYVEQAARQWFRVEKKVVESRFSTLGGNNAHRMARKMTRELILVLRPR